MEHMIEKETKERIVLYVKPSLRRWLRNQRAETDRPVTEIAEELIEIGRSVTHAQPMTPSCQ